MKIVCGTLESLGHAIATLLQLMSLYKGEQEIHIPTLLVSRESSCCLDTSCLDVWDFTSHPVIDWIVASETAVLWRLI